MFDEALDPAQAHGHLDVPDGVQHPEGLRLAALDGKTESRARALALSAEHAEARILRSQEAQIVDARDLRMVAQKIRHQGCVLRRLVHSQRQGFHGPHDHPCGVGIELSAERAA